MNSVTKYTEAQRYSHLTAVTSKHVIFNDLTFDWTEWAWSWNGPLLVFYYVGEHFLMKCRCVAYIFFYKTWNKKTQHLTVTLESLFFPLQSFSVVQPTLMSASSFFIIVYVGVVGCECAHVQHCSGTGLPHWLERYIISTQSMLVLWLCPGILSCICS